MKYDQFEIDIFNEDTDASHEKTLLNVQTGLEKLLISYEPSNIPSVEINISTNTPVDYTELKNLFIQVKNKQNVIGYNVGILDYVYKNGLVVLYGFLCKYDDFNLINSSYLGDTYLKCIKALDNRNIRTNSSDGKDIEFKDDFSFDYWKTQESNIQALHRILLLASKESIYSMDNDNI